MKTIYKLYTSKYIKLSFKYIKLSFKYIKLSSKYLKPIKIMALIKTIRL